MRGKLTTALPSPPIRPALSWRRAFFSLIVAAGSAVEGMGANRADVRRLEAAQQITRELKSGDEHSYEVVLAADQYVEVVAEQHGINLAMALIGPTGQKLMEVDTVKSKDGTELLARIAEAVGTYRIDVRVVGKNAAPGSYRITLRVPRTPTELDRVLEQARRLSEESRNLRAKGAYGEALAPAQAALALREQALGADDLLVGDSLHSLAVLYDDTADYAKAEPINFRALTIREKALGPDHPDVAKTLNNLAWIYSVRHDYAQAEGFYRRALAIQEKAFGGDDPEVATTLNDFALLYDEKGAYEQALEINLRVLSIRERVLGPDDDGVAKALNNVALVYQNKGEYSKAESLYLRALATWEKALGADHPETAFAVDNLASAYLLQGDYARAEPLFQRALAIREKALGPDHPSTALSLNNLAVLYVRTGDRAKAAPLLARTLSAWEKRLGPDNPGVAPSLNNLARLYERAGDYAAAEPLYRRALAVREKSLDPGHSNIGNSLRDLGQLYLRTGKDDVEAERLLRRSREILEGALGSQHPDVARTVGNLAELYERTGDVTRAEEAYQLALTIRENALGPDHPDVASSLDGLGRFYQRNGDLPRALAFMSRTGDVRERNLTHNLPLGSERQKLGYLELFSKDTDNTLSLHNRLAPRDARALQLAFTTLLRRKGRGLDAMSDNVSALHGRSSPEDQAVFRQLSDARSQLALLTLKGPDKAIAARYPALVKQQEDEVDRLEADVSRRSLEFRAQSSPITLAAVQSVIPSDAVLIEFALYRPVDVKRRIAAPASVCGVCACRRRRRTVGGSGRGGKPRSRIGELAAGAPQSGADGRPPVGPCSGRQADAARPYPAWHITAPVDFSRWPSQPRAVRRARGRDRQVSGRALHDLLPDERTRPVATASATRKPSGSGDRCGSRVWRACDDRRDGNRGLFTSVLRAVARRER